MPYKDNSALPPRIVNHLPNHAKTIYREAFNNAWKEYENPEKRKAGGTQEEIAHRVAWAAVKRKYEKNEEDNWIEKQ